MTTVLWQLGEVLDLVVGGHATRYRILGRTGDGLNLIGETDSRAQFVLESELCRMWAAGEARRVRDPKDVLNREQRLFVSRSMDTMTASERAHANWLAPYLMAMKRVKKRIGPSSRRKLEELIDRVAAEKGHARKPSWRTVGHHFRQMQLPGADGRWLAPRVSARGNRTARYGGFEAIIEKVLREQVLIPNRRPLTLVHAHLQRELDAYRAAAPSGERVAPKIDVRTVQRRVSMFQANEKVAAWHGPNAARRKHRPVGAGPEADWPQQRVEIDHHLLDVLVTHPKTGTVLGRPWLTVAIDKFSRMIVGLHVGFEEPGDLTVMLCLRQAIKPKVQMLRDYEMPVDAWPCQGLPETIVVDNGPEFHSSSLDDATTQLGIDVLYCATRTPEQKGSIERWFGSLSTGLIHALPGTTKSNTVARGEYKSEKEAVLTIAELRELIVRWVVGEYSIRVHEGFKGIPLDQWRQGVAAHPVALPTEVEDLDVLLSPTEERTLTRQGVRLHGLHYSTNHRRLGELLNAHDKPDKSVIKFDPSDLGEVRLLDWQMNRFLPLRCLQFEYADGLTLREHQEVTNCARDKLDEGGRLYESDLLAHRGWMSGKIDELNARGKLKGRRAARFSGADEGVAPVRPRKSVPAPEAGDALGLPDPSNDDDDEFADLGITIQTIR
ncbi:Mu transposase C-terminal domain-containing protein [Lichenicoccus roseus]|uniref:DDE-type integrase/transposase/recombinase n=1 Tax=Lichenicoccus roseus TaxID=2683649 RepID=A0A5R9J5U6_9PROT|nr:DDE-type integrase/transposase/recombinase [Lichenicoccus roseus]TLU71887.1 DDE-type integrase/transposase/recombinase [Lichenicoccus roseus]